MKGTDGAVLCSVHHSISQLTEEQKVSVPTGTSFSFVPALCLEDPIIVSLGVMNSTVCTYVRYKEVFTSQNL